MTVEIQKNLLFYGQQVHADFWPEQLQVLVYPCSWLVSVPAGAQTQRF